MQFAVKQGNTDLNVKLNKPSVRWRGMPERPRRHVFLFDISQKMPIDALAGHARVAKKLIESTQTQALSDQMRGRLEYVMGRDYDEARFEYVGDRIRMNRDRVWEALVDIWVEDVVPAQAVNDFTQAVRQSLPAQS